MNKKVIYIFENTNSLHVEESLQTLYEILSIKYDVKLCLGNKTIDRVKGNRLIMANMENLSGIKKIFYFLKQNGNKYPVIFPTISCRNISLVFLISFFIKKNIYYIRNSNSWLMYPKHTKGIDLIVSYITTFFKRRMLRRAHKIIVANENIRDYLKKTFGGNIEIVPFKYFNEKNCIHSQYFDKLRIVVPGSIDISKKDLFLIRDAMKLFSAAELKKIQVVLLGKPSDNKSSSFCEAWKKEAGDSLSFHKNFIPDGEFQKILQQAHCILGLFPIRYIDKYNQETYGESKDTGVEAQAISYGKPFIVNNDFAVVKKISSSSLLFIDSNDLASKIKSLLCPDAYERISLEALKNSRKFTINKIVDELML